MSWRRLVRNPVNRFYLLTLLGPIVMLLGMMLHQPTMNPLSVENGEDMAGLFFRIYLLLYAVILWAIPMIMVVSGLGLPMIGALHVRERCFARGGRGEKHGLRLVYAVALIETVLLTSMFARILAFIQ
ncbi:MAG: hypothetical protein AAGC44_07475 [Planctomycetota bacterium]